LINTARIAGTGMAAPARILTNTELSTMVETSDEWIFTRTGIRERRIIAEGQNVSDLGLTASQEALDRAGVKPEEIDLIIFATMSPDQITPSTACILQGKLGAKRAAAVDVSAACSGFMYGLSMARGAVASGEAETVLLVGGEAMSRFIDWTDRTTCVLFGDAAGAVVLRPSSNGQGVLSTVLGADGSNAGLLGYPAGGSAMPASQATIDGRLHFMKMNGAEIFKNGVRKMTRAVKDALAKCGATPQDLSLFIPHQANKRIIDGVVDSLGLDHSKLFLNVEKYGNTSAASIPVALHEAVMAGRIKKGDLVGMVSFGGGLTWGAAVVRW
jgi:3-oxoacyl-[acyl-carrier-protein] synthase-3